MTQLITTLGPKSASELGMILPHEHVFVDLRTWDKPGYAQADTADVVRLMAPEIERLKASGGTALVECSPLGVGRRADMDKAVSVATQFPIVVPTGVYREPWILPWMHEADEGALYDWMMRELTGITLSSRLRIVDPVGYVEFLGLQRKAALLITDSGGIQEETTFLGVPCITVRENTERPVTVTLGTNILVGRDMERLKAEAKKVYLKAVEIVRARRSTVISALCGSAPKTAEPPPSGSIW